MRDEERAVIEAARHLNHVLNNELPTWQARVNLGQAIIALDNIDDEGERG